MRIAWLLMALALGCGVDLGPARPWTPAALVPAPLTPELGPPPDGAPAALGQRPRVVSFNVERGGDVERLARAIAGHPELSRADLLLLQEIESHPGEDGSRAARLAAALGMGYVYAPARVEGRGTHGLAILSRAPLTDVQVMELPFADLPWNERRRVALAATVETAAGPLRLIDVHLDTRINAATRIEQLAPAVLDAPERTLVAGDVNTNPYLWAGGAVPLLPAAATGAADQAGMLDAFMRSLGFETPSAGLGSTHDGVIDLRLDAIYTRGLGAAAAQVECDVHVSDHFPIWVDIDLVLLPG